MIRGEVWQDGMRVAMVEGEDEAAVIREAEHYAFVYGKDGPVELRIKPIVARKKKEPAKP